MASVTPCIGDCKHAAFRQLDETLIEDICAQHGYDWRDVKLPPGRTIKCFGWQILMGNVPLDAVRHHENGEFTSPALCQARIRFPIAALEDVSDRIAIVTSKAGGGKHDRDALFHGKRVFTVDGTGTTLADSPEVRRYFGCSGKQKPGCGYPTAHVLLLTGPWGAAMKAICLPLRTGDMTHATKLHGQLVPGDLLLGESQFGNWGHLQQLSQPGLDGLFAANHSRKIVWGKNGEHGSTRRFVKSLGYMDQLVEYRKPATKPKWMSDKEFKNAPQWLLVHA